MFGRQYHFLFLSLPEGKPSKTASSTTHSLSQWEDRDHLFAAWSTYHDDEDTLEVHADW